MNATVDARLLEALHACARELTGFRDDAIQQEALRRVARRRLALGHTPEQVESAARAGDLVLAEEVRAAVCVNETFFMRHVQQIDHAVAFLRLAARRKSLRVWSAGCSTGEETYSVAHRLLVAALPGEPLPELLGTDLLERNLTLARTGRYRRWSLRGAEDARFALGEATNDGGLVVAARLRERATFRRHDLLRDPPPEEGPFDLVLCRNVLVYMAPESMERALATLVASVAPGGLLALGPMDLVAPPRGFEPLGGPELQVFVRREKKSKVTIRPRPAPVVAPPPPPAPPPPGPSEQVRLHLEALDALEVSDEVRAAFALGELEARAPDYLPGILERALLAERHGEHEAARALMQRVLEAAREISPDLVLDGPEPLPVSYYVASARAFLEREQSGSER